MMPEPWLASRPSVPINGLKDSIVIDLYSAALVRGHRTAQRHCAAPLRAPRNSLVLQPLPRKQLLVETELTHVRHAHGIEDPIEVIDFVLHHAGVEAADAPIDSAALLVNAAVM